MTTTGIAIGQLSEAEHSRQLRRVVIASTIGTASTTDEGHRSWAIEGGSTAFHRPIEYRKREFGSALSHGSPRSQVDLPVRLAKSIALVSFVELAQTLFQ